MEEGKRDGKGRQSLEVHDKEKVARHEKGRQRRGWCLIVRQGMRRGDREGLVSDCETRHEKGRQRRGWCLIVRQDKT